MSPIAALPRTQIMSLYAKKIPVVLNWAVGIGIIMGWPHAVISVANKTRHVPKINKFIF